ncbi:MAG: glycosyltransferase family 4 protein [Verrucomicrobiaceae bacterium]|nr:glycosyltransferase family 4 protein [Verrucomicrobiaceae bacterium]
MSHVTGNPNSRQAALCMAERGWLAEFHTTLAWRSGSRARVLPAAWREVLEKRAFPPAVTPALRGHPWREVLRLMLRDVFPRMQTGPLARWRGIEHVALGFDRAVGRAVMRSRNVTAVYGYMDSSVETFQAARRRGMRTIYELPSPYWRTALGIMQEEASLQPAWAATLPHMSADTPKMRRRDEELRLADAVVVPSAFVKDSLRHAPGLRAEIHVVPYGGPEPAAGPSRERPAGPLRVLFAGTLTQAKGLSYLDEAARSLGPAITLTLAGAQHEDGGCAALRDFLARHRHVGQLSHAQLLAEMDHHDVLVLPTLLEGMPLVALEAFSRGLPVIATHHAGLGGVLEDGREGFLVPIRDAAALSNRLTRLMHEADLLRKMRGAAEELGRRQSWACYRVALAATLSQVTGLSAPPALN